eukprot:XP_004916490.1 PREDICTED: M-phase inducer phosphatase 1-like [Xenopus tropicalis]
MPYVPYALIGRRDLSNHFFHGMKSAVSASHTLTLQQHLHVGNCEDENENARFAEIEKEIIMKELARLLRGGYQDVVQQYQIVDCRYPYEYAGGHIKGAYNLYKEEHISDTFLKNATHPKSTTLLIFHCEFSSERAPKLCRLLRNLDRNANRYPHLHYPELYILKGGYKEFYEKFKGFCEPRGYVNMLHKDFSDQLRQYHRKNKTCHIRTVRKELFKPLYSNKCTVLKKDPAKD